MTWFGIKWAKKGWYAVKPTNQPTSFICSYTVKCLYISRLDFTISVVFKETYFSIFSTYKKINLSNILEGNKIIKFANQDVREHTR